MSKAKLIITALFMLAIMPAIHAFEGTLTLQGGLGVPISDMNKDKELKGALGLSFDAWLNDSIAIGINPFLTTLKSSDGLNNFKSSIEGVDVYLKLRSIDRFALNFSDKSIINRVYPFVALGAGVAHHGSRGVYVDGDPLTTDAFTRNKYIGVLPHMAAGITMLTKWDFNIAFGLKLDYTTTDKIDNFKDPSLNDGFLTPYIGFAVNFYTRRDRDKDGILDKYDKAPRNPEDFDGFEDSDGAPDPDNDGDGILDVNDGAPNQAEDFDGFQDSDGIPDPDNDNDGILDVDDGAPNSPEDIDSFQDKDGIPDPENDSDLIPDTNDLAPGTDETVRKGIDTKETYNGYEDTDGVPDTVPIAGAPETPDSSVTPKPSVNNEINMELPTVHFDTNYYNISESDKLLLDELANALKIFPDVKLQVQGHTDNTGPLAFNETLAVKRAEAVKNYLVSKNIDSSRMTIKGFAWNRPVDTNDSVNGRTHNRRTDFIILK